MGIPKVDPWLECADPSDTTESDGTDCDSKSVPQVEIWEWLGRDEQAFPWWARCAFRDAVRPWLYRRSDRATGGDDATPSPPYFWMPRPEVLETEDSMSRHTIYATLVSRVQFLQELYEKLNSMDEGRPPRHILLQLALWIDTHQMLMIFVEETGRCADSQLLEPVLERPPLRSVATGGEREMRPSDPWGRRTENGVPVETGPAEMTWFDLYCPSLRHVMHQGELPDLTNIMPIVRCWSDVPRETAAAFDEDMRQMADLFSKASPRPQQSRSMNNICARNVLQYPRIAECFRRMCFCTLAGLYDYPDCGVAISHLFVRHELYRWFCMHPVSDEGLGTWLNGFILDEIKDLIVNHGKKKRKKKVPARNPEAADQPSKILVGYNNEQVAHGHSNMTSFVQFVMNEYMYLLMSRLTSLQDAMESLHWHKVVRRIYLDACDRVRQLMSQWFEPDRLLMTRMMGEYSVPAFDPPQPAGGRELMARLVSYYTPFLRWNLQTDLADAVGAGDVRSGTFQRARTGHGHVRTPAFQQTTHDLDREDAVRLSPVRPALLQ